MPTLAPTWLGADGRLAADKLLTSFVDFWVKHGESLLRTSPYSEAASHLVLIAYLHRVANGGGRRDREYALGSGALDICLRYRGNRLGIEVKTWKDSDKRADPGVAGLPQLDGYLARLGLDRGWLVVFDQRSGVPPLYERAKVEVATLASKRTITVIRL